jgi:gamma-glutamyltranspeptidase
MLTLPDAVKFGGINLATTLNTSMSELRPATMDRTLIIDNNRAWQRIPHRRFSSEGYEALVVPGGVAGLEDVARQPGELECLLPATHLRLQGADFFCGHDDLDYAGVNRTRI